MELEEIVTREQYLLYRSKSEQIEILRAYFLKVTNAYLNDAILDTPAFSYFLDETLREFPGLEEDLHRMYPQILNCFDKVFHVVFITKEEEISEPKIVRVLKGIY